jgi:Ca-activated chloride channel family protein
VIAFGRYSGNGDMAVKLSGTLRGERQTFAYDASFPKENGANAFLTQLWARRKVGYLLDQIRLHGESKELTDEVVRLSKEYGIATPYTSYLVLEDDEAYRQHGIMLGAGLARLREAGVVAASEAQAAGASAAGFQYPEKGFWRAVGGGGAAEGEQAVKLSEHLRVWKEADAVGSREEIGATRVQRVGGKTFLHIGGAYVDTAFTEEMDALTIKWGSDAYFAVLDAVPGVKDYLALGESLVVVISGKALIVADEGKEAMTADQIKAFFAK